MLYLYLVWFPFLSVQVLFLLDISSSMTSHIQELKDSLTHLLEHTPPKMKRYSWCHVHELLLTRLPPRSANCCSLCLRTIPLLSHATFLSFNIVTYASTATQWREQLSSVSEEHCLEAAQWLQSVKAGGCSCLLEALKVYSEFFHSSRRNVSGSRNLTESSGYDYNKRNLHFE